MELFVITTVRTSNTTLSNPRITRITEFLDFARRPEFSILENTAFDLLPSSGHQALGPLERANFSD
jgi:hypothetical protein